VAILDADKEGFLRSSTSLIQTVGRAARNVSGEVHMYADIITPAMTEAIEETERRRAKQLAYNDAHGIDPRPLRKKIADVTDMLAREDVDTAELLAGGYRGHEERSVTSRRKKAAEATVRSRLAGAAESDLASLVDELTAQMHAAAEDLHFELAARLRDEIQDLKKELRDMRATA
jgi:uvrABC system protein B